LTGKSAAVGLSDSSPMLGFPDAVIIIIVLGSMEGLAMGCFDCRMERLLLMGTNEDVISDGFDKVGIRTGNGFGVVDGRLAAGAPVGKTEVFMTGIDGVTTSMGAITGTGLGLGIEIVTGRDMVGIVDNGVRSTGDVGTSTGLDIVGWVFTLVGIDIGTKLGTGSKWIFHVGVKDGLSPCMAVITINGGEFHVGVFGTNAGCVAVNGVKVGLDTIGWTSTGTGLGV
jgi:hypothetical protein